MIVHKSIVSMLNYRYLCGDVKAVEHSGLELRAKVLRVDIDLEVIIVKMTLKSKNLEWITKGVSVDRGEDIQKLDEVLRNPEFRIWLMGRNPFPEIE